MMRMRSNEGMSTPSELHYFYHTHRIHHSFVARIAPTRQLTDMNLNLAKTASRFLDKLPPKQFKQVVNAIFDLLKNPLPQDTKLLEGYRGLYRKSIGEFRIIYRFDRETVSIIAVGSRNDNDIYKLLRRLI